MGDCTGSRRSVESCCTRNDVGVRGPTLAQGRREAGQGEGLSVKARGAMLKRIRHDECFVQIRDRGGELEIGDLVRDLEVPGQVLGCPGPGCGRGYSRNPRRCKDIGQ